MAVPVTGLEGAHVLSWRCNAVLPAYHTDHPLYPFSTHGSLILFLLSPKLSPYWVTKFSIAQIKTRQWHTGPRTPPLKCDPFRGIRGGSHERSHLAGDPAHAAAHHRAPREGTRGPSERGEEILLVPFQYKDCEYCQLETSPSIFF